jgi:hypothetical protein
MNTGYYHYYSSLKTDKSKPYTKDSSAWGARKQLARDLIVAFIKTATHMAC